jgi:hypothetical protein
MIAKLSLAVLALTASAGVSLADPVACVDGGGLHPVVATADAAKTIYRAVASGRGDSTRDNIVVEDHGAAWSVFQYTPPVAENDGKGNPTIILVSGSGTLLLSIDKCDGTIEAHYSR